MVFEIIGKITLYIIGTLLVGGVAEFIDIDCGIYFGAWIASIFVFIYLITLNL